MTTVSGSMVPWSLFTKVAIAIALAIVPSQPSVSSAQSRAIARPDNLVITVLDPLGQPAAQVPLLLESGPFQIPFVREGHTDRNGRYSVRVPAGLYNLSAPVDFFPPTRITVPGDKSIEQTVRMELGETTGAFSICVDCPESEAYTPHESIVEEFRRDREDTLNELVIGAEPEVGWEFFEPQAPDSLRRLGSAAPVGTVVVEGSIDVSGRAVDVRVVSAADAALASAAIATLEGTRWRPARVRGKAVKTPLRLTFVYTSTVAPAGRAVPER